MSLETKCPGFLLEFYLFILSLQCEKSVTQSYPNLCDPCIVHGILQARILEWIAFPFSRGSFQPSDQTQVPTSQIDSLPTEPQGKPNVKQKIKSSVGEEQGKSLARSLPLGIIKSVWATPTFRKPALENKTKLLTMGKTFSFRTNTLFRCVTRACVSFLFRKKKC